MVSRKILKEKMHHGVLLRIFTFVAIVETLFFSIIHLGWSSYVYVLIDRGFYSNLCSHGNYAQLTTTSRRVEQDGKRSGNESAIFSNINTTLIKEDSLSCNQQQESLNLIYSVSVGVIPVVGLSWAFLTYRYGNVKSKFISIFVFTSGLLTLGFATSDYPWMIAVGLILVVFGGQGTLIFNMKLAFCLPFGIGIYIALLNGAADSSVLTFRIIKLLYDNGIENESTMIGIAVLYVIIGSFSAVLHHVFKTSKTKEQRTQSDDKVEDNKGGRSDETTENKGQKYTLKQSICSGMTLTYLIWISLLELIFFMYIGIINARLVQHFPKEVSYFTNIMGNIMTGGMVTSFISGALAEWQKTIFIKENRSNRNTRLLQQIPNLCISSFLAVLLSVLSFSVTRETFYGEFVVLTIFRSFLFSTSMNFNVSVYPAEHTNVIFPLSHCIGGIVATTGYGFFRWYNLSEESQTKVKICLSILSLFTLIHPLNSFLTGTRKEHDTKTPSLDSEGARET